MVEITDNALKLAQLKLAAFKALDGWGKEAGEPFKIGKTEFPNIKPYNFEQRLEMADRLAAWCLKAPPLLGV